MLKKLVIISLLFTCTGVAHAGPEKLQARINTLYRFSQISINQCDWGSLNVYVNNTRNYYFLKIRRIAMHKYQSWKKYEVNQVAKIKLTEQALRPANGKKARKYANRLKEQLRQLEYFKSQQRTFLKIAHNAGIVRSAVIQQFGSKCGKA